MKLSTLIILLVFGTTAIAQMQGTEQVVSKQLYTGTFTVGGDMNTYYPVVFRNGEQNKINHLKIYRSYNEAGPNELSPTHKGGLLLEFEVNYGGWGGQVYGWEVSNLRQTYHTTFGNAAHGMHNKGFIVWLRGGGFLYHYESEKPADLIVALDTQMLIYDHPTIDSYDVYAPEPLTAPNTSNINNHLDGTSASLDDLQMQNARATGYGIVAARNPGKDFSIYMIKWDGVNTLEHNAQTRVGVSWHPQAVIKGNYFSQAFDNNSFSKYSSVLLSESAFNQYKHLGTDWWIVCSTLPPFSEQVNYISNVGIGTTDTKGYKLAVGGQAVAEKVRVTKQQNWSDFVFEQDYPLPNLSEVENHIQNKGHLPGIPAADEIASKGYDLGDMDALLLQKIEELTLYVIEQNKQIEELKSKTCQE